MLRLNFPVEPKVPTEEEYQKKPRTERDEPLRVLAHRKAEWKKQVGTAAALAKAGVPFAFSAEGIDRLESFPGAVRQMITAGLSADLALAGSDEERRGDRRRRPPAGDARAGQARALDRDDGSVFGGAAKVRYVLVDGLKFEIKPEDRLRTKGRLGSARRPGERG